MKRGSVAMKRRWNDPDYRARVSEGMKRRWNDPEYRERVTEALRRAHSAPERRAQMAEAMRGRWEASGLALPPMTPEQRKVYDKLRRLIGRDAALAEALRDEKREAA